MNRNSQLKTKSFDETGHHGPVVALGVMRDPINQPSVQSQHSIEREAHH